MQYFVYMVMCADGTYYTGITTNVERRVNEHNNSKLGARYTKSRRPVVLRHSEEFPDKSKALKREAEIKKLSRSDKIKLFEISRRVDD